MPDGLVKTVHVIAHIRMNDLGQPEFMGTAMDVTAFKQIQWRLQASLEERDALLKEVHHRVKNNLQLISSLLSLQAARIADPPSQSCSRKAATGFARWPWCMRISTAPAISPGSPCGPIFRTWPLI